MATRIRLKRFGAKHNPHYRIAVMDQRKPRDGRAIEEIGHYDPNTDPSTVQVNADRAQYWLSVGAQPSETVKRLFTQAGVTQAPQAQAAEAPDAEEAAAEVAADEASEEA